MNSVISDKMYRPLQMMHAYGYDESKPMEDILQTVREKLEQVKEIGCGGVVTNVSFQNYLESEKQWEIFTHVIRLCKELGLRVWLYDEKGYPSGGAGGIVVRDHPEYEAIGLVCLTQAVQKTQHVVMTLPRNHKKAVAVYMVTGEVGDGTEQDLMPYVDEDGTLCFDATEDGTVYYIASKALFEGVHASRNYHEVRPYVNVLDKKAMEYFINVTYGQYKKYVGEEFGDLIEAVFTDEPSVMGPYCAPLNTKKYNVRGVERVDEKMPLYPHVVWSCEFEAEFTARKGYKIMPLVPLLFAGDSTLAQQVRFDYHDVAAQLYEEAYFVAIRDFCRENNIKFTGHLLAEELFYTQIINEYDYFQMMRNMDYTGIDVLSADPKKVLRAPLLPKIASSVAHHYGAKTVMSESSDFTRRGTHDLSAKEAFASFAVQYVFGVTQLTSYFAIDKFALEEYKKLNNAVARMGRFITDGAHKAPLLLYYPARSSWQYALPSVQIMSQCKGNGCFAQMSDLFDRATVCFAEQCVDYDITDGCVLAACEIKDRTVISPSGEAYRAVYVPCCDIEKENLIDVLKTLAAQGVAVYVERRQLNKTAAVTALMQDARVTVVEDANEAIADMHARRISDMKAVCDEPHGVACVHKTQDGEERYLLVNALNEQTNFTLTLQTTKKPRFVRLYENEAIEIPYTCNGTETVIDLQMDAFEVLTICCDAE